jgi:hypothetical protein
VRECLNRVKVLVRRENFMTHKAEVAERSGIGRRERCLFALDAESCFSQREFLHQLVLNKQLQAIMSSTMQPSSSVNISLRTCVEQSISPSWLKVGEPDNDVAASLLIKLPPASLVFRASHRPLQ